jgi:hypothetical protein
MQVMLDFPAPATATSGDGQVWADEMPRDEASNPAVPVSPPACPQSPDESDGRVFHAMVFIDAVEDKLKHVPQAQRAQFALALEEFRESVFKECEFPPFPPEREFQINLQPRAQVPASPVHKLSPALLEQLRGMIKELLHNGLTIPTSSPFAAPLLLVKKPDGGSRVCIDYRTLNAVSIEDWYPLPNSTMLFNRLAGCNFFSKLDLRWEYFQVRTAEADVGMWRRQLSAHHLARLRGR